MHRSLQNIQHSAFEPRRCWLPYDITLCEGLTLGRRSGSPERVMMSIATPIARAVQDNPARLDNEEFVNVRGFAKNGNTRDGNKSFLLSFSFSFVHD